jgi:hypothetical protein
VRKFTVNGLRVGHTWWLLFRRLEMKAPRVQHFPVDCRHGSWSLGGVWGVQGPESLDEVHRGVAPCSRILSGGMASLINYLVSPHHTLSYMIPLRYRHSHGGYPPRLATWDSVNDNRPFSSKTLHLRCPKLLIDIRRLDRMADTIESRKHGLFWRPSESTSRSIN